MQVDAWARRGARVAFTRGAAGAFWVTVRVTIEEKLEPVFEESQELLVRVVPQVAALA